jgi:hypothetical protein
LATVRCAAADRLVDPMYVRMSPGQLSQTLVENESNVDGMCETVRRAVFQGHGEEAYEDLSRMAAAHPANTCIQQGMYFIETVAEGKFAPWFGSRIEGLPFDTIDNVRSQRLGAILKADPKPWLALIIDGQERFTSLSDYDRGLYEIKTAVRYAPNSAFAHAMLGFVLASPHTPVTDLVASANEERKAYGLDPTLTMAAMCLFDFNVGEHGSHTEAMQWKAVVISLNPAGEAGLDPLTKQFFDKFR